MKKKHIAGLLCALLAGTLVFSACTKSEDPNSGTNGNGQTEDGQTNGGQDGNLSVTPSEDVNQIWTDIKEAIGEDNLVGSIVLNAEDIESLYGLSEEDIKQFAGSVPMMNVVAEEFLIVEAQEGKVEDVEAGMKARQTELERQWSEYLPDQYELVQNAKIIKSGNFVLFCVSENADTAVQVFEAHTK